MIGGRVVLVINLIIFQYCVTECYGKESYTKDSQVAKNDKCKQIIRLNFPTSRLR